jgi:molybdopterin converting factor small subunit
MKIQVEFLGLPMVSDIIGAKKLKLDFPGETVKDVMDELVRRHGKKLGDTFYDTDGHFDPMIQIALNGKLFIDADQHDTVLNEGDNLVFILLLAGG